MANDNRREKHSMVVNWIRSSHSSWPYAEKNMSYCLILIWCKVWQSRCSAISWAWVLVAIDVKIRFRAQSMTNLLIETVSALPASWWCARSDSKRVFKASWLRILVLSWSPFERCALAELMNKREMCQDWQERQLKRTLLTLERILNLKGIVSLYQHCLYSFRDRIISDQSDQTSAKVCSPLFTCTYSAPLFVQSHYQCAKEAPCLSVS